MRRRLSIAVAVSRRNASVAGGLGASSEDRTKEVGRRFILLLMPNSILIAHSAIPEISSNSRPTPGALIQPFAQFFQGRRPVAVMKNQVVALWEIYRGFVWRSKLLEEALDAFLRCEHVIGGIENKDWYPNAGRAFTAGFDQFLNLAK